MRALLTALVLTSALTSGATAQIGAGFTTQPGNLFALVGCDVAGPGEPQVRFVQLPDRVILRPVIGSKDLVGESCAEVLDLLLDSGFKILDSRPIQQNAAREILVYDLIGR